MKKILAIAILVPFIAGAQVSPSAAVVSEALIKQLQETIKFLQAQILELRSQLEITKKEVEQVKTEQAQLALAVNRPLARGMRGEEVQKLQKFLKEQFPDVYTAPVTGFFGPLTEIAVKTLQEKFNIKKDGVVGENTVAKINESLLPPAPASTPAPSQAVSEQKTEPTTVAATTASLGGPAVASTGSANVGSGGGTGSASLPLIITVASGPSTTTTSTYTTALTDTISAPDSLGPWITRLSISPTSISPGEQVNLVAEAEDSSGIVRIIYDIKYPPTNLLDGPYYLRPLCNFNNAKIATTCVFTGTIDHAIQPTVLGSYIIESIRALDTLGNISTYYPNGSVTNSLRSSHNLSIPTIVVGATPPPIALPDLTIFGFNSPTNAVAGSAVTLTVQVRNAGQGVSPPPSVLVAFSKTSDYDTVAKFYRDVIPETKTTLYFSSGLSPGAIDAKSWATTIPQTTQTSLYFVAKADPENVIAEPEENNNAGGTQINISQPAATYDTAGSPSSTSSTSTATLITHKISLMALILQQLQSLLQLLR